ncbi:MAG: DNA glycosylase AlkZ-like family protein [Promethearchaeota archaeon]
MDTLELNKVNKLILKKQHLTEDSKIDDLIQITDDVCGLHSTNLTTSFLSLFARTKNFEKTDLERELYTNRTLGRIRGMRKTLFIQTKNMIPIVYSATFNMIEKYFEKYMEFHNFSLKEYQEVSGKIMNILKGRELSASEIRKELNSNLSIPAIIQLMCDNGVLLRVKQIKDWKDRRNKYALFKEYFPSIDLKKIDEKKATQLLLKKYLERYGPVSENDMSWWIGLPKSQIREALKNIEPQLNKIKISSIKGTFIISNSDIVQLQNSTNSNKPLLTLLPELDPYPMGYKERERYIEFNNYNKVFDRSGNISSSIFLDGVIIGVWDAEEKPEPVVKFYLFRSIDKDLFEELCSKVQKIGKFYFNKEVPIKECESMTPLTERTAGGFMRPLKNC